MKVNNTKNFGEMIKKRRNENGKATIELGKAIYLANLLGIDIEMNERG